MPTRRASSMPGWARPTQLATPKYTPANITPTTTPTSDTHGWPNVARYPTTNVTTKVSTPAATAPTASSKLKRSFVDRYDTRCIKEQCVETHQLTRMSET